MDIRQETVIIIKRGPEYLVGRIMGGSDLKWSTCPWDAWRTKDQEDAEDVARATGGDLWLFNPIAGQTRRMKTAWNLPPLPPEYEGDARSTWWYVCGECHTAVDWKQTRCNECGRRIRWE